MAAFIRTNSTLVYGSDENIFSLTFFCQFTPRVYLTVCVYSGGGGQQGVSVLEVLLFLDLVDRSFTDEIGF